MFWIVAFSRLEQWQVEHLVSCLSSTFSLLSDFSIIFHLTFDHFFDLKNLKLRLAAAAESRNFRLFRKFGVVISSLFYIFDLFLDLRRPQVGENATIGDVASRQKADLRPPQVGQN